MNYLAHALLSGNDTNILIGNFAADHIKMVKADHLPLEVQKGIILHRRIDNFTDSHPLFINSKRFFVDGFELYSGVLLDIYFDHLLAKHFERYSKIPLQEFVDSTYKLLQENQAYLPETAIRFLEYAVQRNTFFEYSKIEGITLVLQHLSYRIKHRIELSESVPMFIKHEKEIEKDFFVFMKELIAYVEAETPKL